MRQDKGEHGKQVHCNTISEKRKNTITINRGESKKTVFHHKYEKFHRKHINTERTRYQTKF